MVKGGNQAAQRVVQKYMYPGGGMAVLPGFRVIAADLLQVNPYVRTSPMTHSAPHTPRPRNHNLTPTPIPFASPRS